MLSRRRKSFVQGFRSVYKGALIRMIHLFCVETKSKAKYVKLPIHFDSKLSCLLSNDLRNIEFRFRFNSVLKFFYSDKIEKVR